MKQVLLIGDSIRMGYCEAVKEALNDCAEVIFPSENCMSSQYIIMRLIYWCNLCEKDKVAIVHLNCGQWDVGHFNGTPEPLTSLEEYRKNLRMIVWTLRNFFPEAQIMLATTTPMNPAHPETINPRTTEEIIEYNRVVKEVAQELGLPVNDFFGESKDWSEELYLDYCHLTDEGYQRLAKKVTEAVSAYI